MNLYKRIGEDNITIVVTEFYKRAFEDRFIGHFFFNKDRVALTKSQVSFAIGMLGGPKNYIGQPLEKAHSEFSIRKAHFDRRQVILKEVMESSGLSKVDLEEWLLLEENLRRLIITVVDACNHKKDGHQAI